MVKKDNKRRKYVQLGLRCNSVFSKIFHDLLLRSRLDHFYLNILCIKRIVILMERCADLEIKYDLYFIQ